MPEGPELAISRDMLRPVLVGNQLLHMGFMGRYANKSPEGYQDLSFDLSRSPADIVEVDVKGKFMWWKLSIAGEPEPWYVWCTYGMTGQWSRSASKHTSIITYLGDETRVFFNDQRRFGTIKFVKGDKLHQKKLSTLGPCILGGSLTSEIFAKNILKKPSITIAEALMDQGVISGVGNYIKAECLYRASISPWRIVTAIATSEFVKLHREVLDVARESYESQGATIYTYKNVDESEGSAQFEFQAYGRKTCPRGHDIVNEQTPEGRTSWWCQTCQK